MRLLPLRSLSLVLALAGSALFGTACGPTIEGPGARSPVAEKWQLEAKASYRAGDFDDAAQACDSGIQVAPKDVEIRVLAARVALAKLDFTKAAKLTEGLDATDAHAVRGRALWYLGDMEQAADELEAMLRDPQVKDPCYRWHHLISLSAERGQDIWRRKAISIWM